MPKVDIPGGSVENNPPANAGDASSIPRSGKPPQRRKWQPTPVFLPGESHGQRSLAGYSAQDCKESNTTEHAHIHNVKLGFDPISDTEFYLTTVLVDTSI